MIMETPGLFLAFLAGLLSFFSPCVLAVAPGYLAMLSGTLPQAEDESGLSQAMKRKALAGTVFFIIGFTLVFILMGTALSVLGRLLLQYRLVFLRIGGGLLILLGLFQLGFIKSFTLHREFRFQVKKGLTGPVGWLVTGAAFAFGWTPCVGPILSMILVVAASAERVFTGVTLLFFYSLGMAIPFLLLAVAFSTFYAWYRRVLPYSGLLGWVTGGLLIVVGLLLFFDEFKVISSWFNQFFGNWSLEEFLEK
ncbi:MAG TPA: cytochrome c biogenesis protein CcdA [Firmicutes bacterium]|jgi:cytochrome c-type biogenesis protein|nr:cytochrome c biogenesis protein CcdA [Bacillota bacterium]